ncbi:MAG: hypothetical protein WD065_12535 [Planctomycetaceae bacterium]
MKDLIRDTLIWFGGFIAIALGLLIVARKLTQRSRTFEQTFKTLKSDASVTPAGIEQAGRFSTGLSELFRFQANADEGKKNERNVDLVPQSHVHGSLTMALIVVVCGSLAGGAMWSLTAEPRSWLGVMIGLVIATIAAGIGLWTNTGRTTATLPTLNRVWADMLELLALHWTSAGPQEEMMHAVAKSIEPRDAALAAFVIKAAALPIDESPLGIELTHYQSSPWPESTAGQVQWFLETSCRIRLHLANALRHDADVVAIKMKYAIWMFLAPSLYLILLTPPGVEMASFFRSRPADSRPLPAEEGSELPQPALAIPDDEPTDGESVP